MLGVCVIREIGFIRATQYVEAYILDDSENGDAILAAMTDEELANLRNNAEKMLEIANERSERKFFLRCGRGGHDCGVWGAVCGRIAVEEVERALERQDCY